MKRIICFLLAVLMLVSLVACGDTPDVDESTGEDTTAPIIAEKIAAEKYDGVFKAGYAIANITPRLPINKKDSDGTYTKKKDDLYATCVAVNDGENTALFITVDVTSLDVTTCNNFKKYITNATKVPAENIIISATHTHTAPTPGIPASGTNNILWLTAVNNAMVDIAKESIADLADAEIYNGTVVVDGMAFVRRGYHTDGSPAGIWRQSGDKNMASYESKADNSVQIIKFVREDKKDIVISNLQTHFTDAGLYLDGVTISADLADVLRNMMAAIDEDLLFAVYVGASGNIAPGEKVPGTKVFSNFNKMGKAVAEAIVAAELTKVEAGKIQATAKKVTTNVRKEDAETVENAKKVKEEQGKLADKDPQAYAIAAKYGFECTKEAGFIISRNTKYEATRDHTIVGISFGDLAFIGVPYEMFDTNGMEVKNGSPFNMTFVLTNAGGAGAYVPSALAVPNGGYEVYSAVDEFGTAERMVGEYLEILRAHKGIK